MTAPALDVDDVIRRLRLRFDAARAESDLREQTATPWERELLWRAALPVRFDAEVVASVFAPGLPETPVHVDPHAWLRAHPDMEEATLPFPTLSARMGARSELCALPVSPPAPRTEVERFRSFAARLADHLGNRGQEWELDALGVLAIADPALAQRHASRRFRTALGRTDFTRCFEVLRVLEDRRELLRALAAGDHPWVAAYRALLAEADELRRRYDAARGFAGDFERTAHVLERKAMADAWRWLSRPAPTRHPNQNMLKGAPRATRDHWILNLEAQGGAGKTMFLRWLSSRKCIREGIPYARLDFDFVEPRLTSAAPWYLLAFCARVLDAQLPGRPLQGIVARSEDVVPFDAFAHGTRDVARALNRLRSDVSSELGPRVIAELARALASAPAVVLVLDTLEVAMVHPGADVMALLRELQRLHDLCPNVRVILSGRFALEARVPGFAAEFGNRTHRIDLPRLSEAESMTYLAVKRGMPKGPVARAIAHRCRGLPFALSLFADEWQIKPSLSVREVREIPGPELHYLVERVLDRVPRPIAWLLRYGVVARRLTRDVVADVILPELEQLRSGSRRFDDPLKDTQVVGRYFQEARLALGEEVLSADLLWADLERYASTFSFVSRDPARPHCLVLHEDVVRPMRRELSRHAVLRRLHSRAMQLAESRAGALEPAREGDWAAEYGDAMYHALRASPSAGRKCWQRANDLTLRQRAFAARSEVAGELLDEEVDVATDLRLEAARARTESLIALGLRHRDTDWTLAAAAHLEWRKLLRKAKRKPDAAFHVARVRIASRSGLPQGSGLRTLEKAIAATRRRGERLELHAALVEGLACRPAARRHIKAARAILAAGKHDWSPTSVQRFKVVAAEELCRQGAFGEALKVVAEVARRERYLVLDERIALAVLQANLLTTCGKVSRVGPVFQRALKLDGSIAVNGAVQDAAALDARVALRTESIRAATYGDVAPFPDLTVSPVDPAVEAAELCNDARLAAARLDPARALELLQQARRLAGPANVEMVARALARMAWVAWYQVGDARLAREVLQEAGSLTIPQGDADWWDVNYRTALLGGDPAPGALDRMEKECRRFPTVTNRLATGLAALTAANAVHGESRDKRLVAAGHAVLGALRDIHPVEARWRLLYQLLPGAHHAGLPVSLRTEAFDVLELGRAPARERRSLTPLERWVITEWTGLYDGPADGWPAGSALDVAVTEFATSGEGVPLQVDERILETADASEFARGIACYACARHHSANGRSQQATLLARRARDLLMGPSVPPSIWLVKATLLLYRLDGVATERPEVLLGAEELCERLDAPGELAEARTLLGAVRVTQVQPPVVRLPVSLIGITSSTVFRGTESSRVLRAVRADARESGSQRLPFNVVHELANDFPAALRDLTHLVLSAEGARDRPEVRLVFLVSEPAVAALPLELAVERAEYGAPPSRAEDRLHLALGWRSDEPPRETANERWALRIFDALGVRKALGDSSDLTALARAFQGQHKLPATGELDPITLRRMTRAIRNDANPRIAVILANPADGIYGARLLAESMYNGQPADVVVEAEGSRRALATLRDQPFDVIHIVAPVVESASFGGLAFDLRPGDRQGRGADVAGGQYLSLSELVGAIRRPASLLRPVVIVHNSLEELPVAEAVRQYCLRNVMALDLSRSGGPVAVVAISGGLLGSVQAGIGLLAEGLLAGEPLLNFLDRLRQRTSGNGEPLRPRHVLRGDQAVIEELQLHGTCVYANNPAFVTV